VGDANHVTGFWHAIFRLGCKRSEAAKRTTGRNTGQPWWNSDCKAAADKNRRDLTLESARKLRNAVRKAKNKYWAIKLDLVTDPIDVFRMTKWHQSTSIYRSPPLKDPSHSDNPPAKSIEEKRELLVAELLINKAEAGDIPPDTLTAATRHIDFPPITAEDARKAVIEAGNTAPRADEVPTAIL
jgi:hypothetical protein